MKRYTFFVCLLSAFTSASAQTQREHSSCDEDSINPQKEAILSEITVTGLTGTQRMKDSPIAFSVISSKTLHHSFGTNITDAISQQPGMAQITTGAGISKPAIRGLGYNRVVVVEQGIRQEVLQWGDEHGLEVDAEGVHSVELLKGPASLMYGSDAIAGVMILHPEHPLIEGTMQVKAGGEFFKKRQATKGTHSKQPWRNNCIELTLFCQNLFNRAYQPHLSRLKYTDFPGIHAMGRNICLKINIPVDIQVK